MFDWSDIQTEHCHVYNCIRYERDDYGILGDQARGGREVSDLDSIAMSDVPTGAVFHHVLRVTGGGCPFVDVTDKAGPIKLEWSATAPSWRRARHGLCLEGECTNRYCEAYDSMS